MHDETWVRCSCCHVVGGGGGALMHLLAHPPFCTVACTVTCTAAYVQNTWEAKTLAAQGKKRKEYQQRLAAKEADDRYSGCLKPFGIRCQRRPCGCNMFRQKPRKDPRLKINGGDGRPKGVRNPNPDNPSLAPKICPTCSRSVSARKYTGHVGRCSTYTKATEAVPEQNVSA